MPGQNDVSDDKLIQRGKIVGIAIVIVTLIVVGTLVAIFFYVLEAHVVI